MRSRRAVLGYGVALMSGALTLAPANAQAAAPMAIPIDAPIVPAPERASVTVIGSSAVMAGDRLTVFARNARGELTHELYDRQQQRWTDWIDLGSGQIN